MQMENVGQPFSIASTTPLNAEGLSARLFSVGHSHHELAQFIALLRKARVTAIADVRSSPYSRRQPQYNRQDLESALCQCDIAYVFLGDQLGGRPIDRDLYDDKGRVDYERVRRTRAFRQGLDRLLHALEQYRVALLCSEEDPLDCHRGLMITPALQEWGIAPSHLRKDGSVETTTAMEERLLAETPIEAGLWTGLFRGLLTAEDRREMLAEAYRKRAQKKAYQIKEELDEGG
jgi:uncharacterized protein (DUF488 family)